MKRVLDYLSFPRQWSYFARTDIARAILSISWLESAIRSELNIRGHATRAHKIKAEIYCLHHGTDTRDCPADGVHDDETAMSRLNASKSFDEERFEKCDAGIVGGCGACVKCDPEWWQYHSDGPLKRRNPLVTMTPEEIENFIPATNEEIETALERGRQEAEAAFPRPGSNLNMKKDTDK